jgi:L-asparagine transporter-like permease
MGLENSKIFTLLMVTGVLSISGLLAVVTHVRGNMETWHHGEYFPKGFAGVRFMSSLTLS